LGISDSTNRLFIIEANLRTPSGHYADSVRSSGRQTPRHGKREGSAVDAMPNSGYQKALLQFISHEIAP